jgi:hypothetical protein
MSLFALSNRKPNPDPHGGFRGLKDACQQALDMIRGARPSVEMDRRVQEQTQGIYPQSPRPVHHDPRSNAPVQATRPGTNGRVGGPAQQMSARPSYVPPTTFPKTLD